MRDAVTTTRTEITRPSITLINAARAFSSATLHEAAGQTGALPSAIRPIAAGFRLCGPALTVHSPGGHNLWLHRAIYAAEPDDVLVVHTCGRYEHGYWGEIMSTAAKIRSLGDSSSMLACETASCSHSQSSPYSPEAYASAELARTWTPWDGSTPPSY